MALQKENNQEDTRECPVCYDSLAGIERTLSCGHVFCHDCLVKTLVSINGDGNIRDTIACPVCRHLTFITRQSEALQPLLEKKDPNEGQTLEVPLPVTQGGQLQSARRVSRDALLSGSSRITLLFCKCISWKHQQQRTISSSPNAHQVFIISAQGRPMTEEDALDVVLTVVNPQRRRRRTGCVCTTARCLVFLLSTFTALALVTLTLPWILLA
ncbi:RING finger protein 222 [Oryzias melastigma]|uniref:RING finger protein 222 n=1 Tax=Oryzias melastigma TaxID=30732 RepID=A0A3B3BMK9_ORYME|nr:RING finger protein 222 [Oryzias melastigma]KAF6727799.1 RING finger protein 222 [Oryzias melastigma]